MAEPRRAALLYALGIGACLLGVVLFLFLTGVLEGLEQRAYDLRFRIKGGSYPSSPIVLVTIDDESSLAMGRKISQWPRTLYAQAIRNLTNSGAKVIGYDLDFSLPNDTRFDPDGDSALAGAIAEAGNIILARYVRGNGTHVPPLPQFQQGEMGEGMISLPPDSDGKIRKVPLVFARVTEQGTEIFFSFPLEVAIRYTYGGKIPEPDFSRKDLFTVGSLSIPYPDGSMLINFHGPNRTFPRIPFYKIIKGDLSPDDIKGKIVLIGNTSKLWHDFYPTPFTSGRIKVKVGGIKEIQAVAVGLTSGIEIHANALDTILSGRFPQKLSTLNSVLLVIALGALSAVLFIVLSLSPWVALILAVVLLCAIFFGGQFVFSSRDISLDSIPLFAVIGLNYIGGVAYHRLLERRERAFVTQTFGHYVSPQVVDVLIRRPELARLGGEKKVMTVLFSDIRGFTTISEGLDPQDLVHLLNEYMNVMTKVIFKNEGVVDKFIGDAIMALFGAPLDVKDHAYKACLTALDMLKELKALRAKLKKENKPDIDIGIGINTGVMTVGNMGSDLRFDYTVIGDNVNLASRLEGLNKEYGTHILISESTYKEVKERLTCKELGSAKVKGKTEPVKIFELLGKGRE